MLKNELENEDNSWLKIDGKYNNDPQFDEMLADIEAERLAINIEAEKPVNAIAEAQTFLKMGESAGHVDRVADPNWDQG